MAEGCIRVGNAPCSWGVQEGVGGERIDYRRMLDELAGAGYRGTELGDWGFMPTDPDVLRAELEQRGLRLLGAYVPVALKRREAHAEGEARALRTARLLAATASAASQPEAGPFLVLADDNGTEVQRTQHAGRVRPELGLSASEWRVFASGAERIARAVHEETGLSTVFHPHCGGYVETPEEIARLLELVDPALIGLVFDTGHYAYGTGTSDPGCVADGLARFGEWVRYVHLKDCEPAVAERARAEGWDYFEAIRRGLFCELGQGYVDFPAVVDWLRAHDYRGWLLVEQDVLPGMGEPKASAERNRAYLRTLRL